MKPISKTCFQYLILVAAGFVLSSCGVTSPQPTLPSKPIAATVMPVPSSPPTATRTAAPSPTPTPPPTNTPTPLPGWVTGFAQPILAAIADRPPGFQDDFGPGSAAWEAAGWCGRRMKYLEGEMVVTDCRLTRPGINYTDFVVEFDGRFPPGAAVGSKWLFHFRDLGGPSHTLDVHYNGDVDLYFKTAAAEDATTGFSYPRAAHPEDQANHFLVIGKGSRFAVYLNGQPLSYAEVSYIRYGDFRFFADGTVFALDNFKVWNIADISIP
jgi:hypothetical protein